MMTHNFQEMIQSKPNNDFEYADFDPNDTMPDKKEDLATGLIDSEAVLIPVKMPEIQDSNYQPESEEALIDYVVSQNNKLEVAIILVKWEIGRSIKSFYQGKYGARELEKIAVATGIGRDSLNKMIKFAEQYTLEQLKTLIEGKFAVSWNGIAHNLAIKPEKLIEVYEKAGNIREFHSGLMNCKDPAEKRGKAKPPKSIEAPAVVVVMPEQPNIASTEITVAMISEKVAMIAAPEIIANESILTEYSDVQKVSNDQINQGYEKYSKELESLRIENQRLKEEVAEEKRKFRISLEMLDEDDRDAEVRCQIIEAYRERFKRLRYAIEDGCSASEIIELLAAVE